MYEQTCSVMLPTQGEETKGRSVCIYCDREKHVPIKRTGPPLGAERDSVLLTRLPSNYDVTAVHNKEKHHDRDRRRDRDESDRHGYYEQISISPFPQYVLVFRTQLTPSNMSEIILLEG